MASLSLAYVSHSVKKHYKSKILSFKFKPHNLPSSVPLVIKDNKKSLLSPAQGGGKGVK